MKLSRRSFLGRVFVPVGAVAVFGVLLPHAAARRAGAAGTENAALPDVEQWRAFSDTDWAARLTPEQFHILREEGTERAYTSSLNDEKRVGTYHCAGCDLALFSSDTKFDSKTGWPSFYAPIDDTHVVTRLDFRLIFPRREAQCGRCLGHLGHVFKDGPPPTGLRYCINGDALTFRPKV